MHINHEVANHNANILFINSSNTNYTVDNTGRLTTISNWNLIGRLVKWIKNLNGSVTKKINEVVGETLKFIIHTNNEFNKRTNPTNRLFYIEKEKTSFDSSSSLSYHYAAFNLSERIKENPKFAANPQIQNYATELLEQKSCYPKLLKHMKNDPYSTYGNPYDVENFGDKVIWDAKYELPPEVEQEIANNIRGKYPGFATNLAVAKLASEEVNQEFQNRLIRKLFLNQYKYETSLLSKEDREKLAKIETELEKKYPQRYEDLESAKLYIKEWHEACQQAIREFTQT